MTGQQLAKFKLPDVPGVYFFKKGSEILYIGKATSLRDRTKSYFAKDLIETRGPMIVDMVFKANRVDWQQTETVLEALILEAALIKRHLPYYNVKEKDDKSWNYVVITKEEMPRVLTVRGRDLEKYEEGIVPESLEHVDIDTVYGPFTSGGQFKEAIKIIRRIFPFMDGQSSRRDNYEFYRQVGLNPDLSNEEAIEAYRKNIRNLKLFFSGKKGSILKALERDMHILSKEHRFEEAARTRDQIFALKHINDTALIKNENFRDPRKAHTRIEAYDIAHMSGKNMVGVMTVVTDNEIDKAEYRKFIIRTQEHSNDIGALEEVLSRRFRHSEWGIPDLVVMDGGVAQKRVGEQVLKRYQLSIPVVSVVKDERHKPREILGITEFTAKHEKAIILANAEAHRFAITFHKKKRGQSFLPKS
jgi:excinuclease UvrABC nuclease subunit